MFALYLSKYRLGGVGCQGISRERKCGSTFRKMGHFPYYFIPSKSANKKPLSARRLIGAHIFRSKILLFFGIMYLPLIIPLYASRYIEVN
jgi:hypothetical protein